MLRPVQAVIKSAYDAEYAFANDIFDEETRAILESDACKEEELTLFDANVIEEVKVESGTGSTTPWKALAVALQTGDHILRLPRTKRGQVGGLMSRGSAKRQRREVEAAADHAPPSRPRNGTSAGKPAPVVAAAATVAVVLPAKDKPTKGGAGRGGAGGSGSLPKKAKAFVRADESADNEEGSNEASEDEEGSDEGSEDINSKVKHACEFESHSRSVHIDLDDEAAMVRPHYHCDIAHTPWILPSTLDSCHVRPHCPCVPHSATSFPRRVGMGESQHPCNLSHH
jgi:hypothetical protein